VRRRAGGFSDWLVDAAERRRAIADACLSTFRMWGYDLVSTPLIERVDTLAAGIASDRHSQLFRFVDSDGSLLGLVAERTVGVARAVATELQDRPLPLRLSYGGSVLRNQPLLGGRRRENLQVGCELIGNAGLDADAECVALAAAAAGAAHLQNVQIDIGHADFIPGLLETAGLSTAEQTVVLAALSARDLVAVESALTGTAVGDVERDLLLTFPTLRGGREVIDVAARGLRGERPLRALNELIELWERVAAHDVPVEIHVDLGAVRDWDYYTGPTFELFSGDLGFPIGSGGRYDSLLGRFGRDAPATGFVLHIDRCTDLALRDAEVSQRRPVEIRAAVGAETAALAAARDLRRRGVRVVVDLGRPASSDDAVRCDRNGDIVWTKPSPGGSGDAAAFANALGVGE